MTNKLKLNIKAFELIEKNKTKILNICSFKEFRSKVSSLSVGLVLCKPKAYFDTLISSSQKEVFELIREIYEELAKADGAQCLFSCLNSNNKIEELKFKRDSQKYFAIIKNAINLESIEDNRNA